MVCEKNAIRFKLFHPNESKELCDVCLDTIYASVKVGCMYYCWYCFCKRYYICHENKHILKPHCHEIYKIKW